MAQLALPLRLDDHAVFESFLPSGNETLVAALEDTADGNGPGCWVWGRPATGKTHLLQAVCARAGDRSVYVPLAALCSAGPDIIEGLASRELVCLDDFDAIAGEARWEEALFDLFNQLQDADGQLLISAPMSPRECPVRLPDLRSRLTRLPVFHVHALDDGQRLAALQLRAGHRGLELPAETAKFMINRSRRDMDSLYRLLDKLDIEALRAQRRLTIPFVREVLRGIETD